MGPVAAAVAGVETVKPGGSVGGLVAGVSVDGFPGTEFTEQSTCPLSAWNGVLFEVGADDTGDDAAVFAVAVAVT